MIRGTTPIHTFRLPMETLVIKNAKIIYAQDDEVILTKELSCCEIGEKHIRVRLSQEETLLFDCRKAVQIQLRVLTLDGDALATKPIRVVVGKCFENEVLT